MKEIVDAFPEGFEWPSREEVQDGLRQARHVITHARHTAEDAIEDASGVIRRHPLAAVAAAAAAGALLGATCVGAVAVLRRLRSGPCAD
jgi:hypothetical protein